MKKLAPLDGWVTLTGCGLMALYTIGLLMNWWEKNEAAENFMLLIMGVGIARKADKGNRELKKIKNEIEKIEQENESLEDRIRRNQSG